jgi:hypothetical protein
METLKMTRILNGEVSALDAYIELYEAKKLIEEQLDEIRDLAIQEREKYGKESPMRNGYLVEIAPGRKNWNYKGVSAWNSVKARLTDIEKMAQMAYNGAEVTDKETGEVVEPAELSFTKDSIKLTYKGQ